LPAFPWLSYLFPLFLIPLHRLAMYAVNTRSGLRNTALVGFTYGLGFAIAIMSWIPRLAPDYLVYRWIMWPALVALSAYLALFPAAAFTAAVLLARRSRVPVPWLLAATWTASEWISGRGSLAFTWLDLGYGWWGAPVLFQSLDLWGLFGLSFVTLVIAGLLAQRTKRGLALAAALLAAGVGYGVLRLRQPASTEATLDVALIQPNLGVSEKWEPENREALFQRYLHQSRKVVGEGVDLLVWPETATPFLLLYAQPFLDRIGIFVGEHHTPLLTGTPHALFEESAETHYNAAVLFTDARPDTLLYYKRQLVPFSEWLPWNILRVMEVNFGQASFTPGTRAEPLPIAGHAGGVLICIEAIYPHLARASVRAGADFFVNITNDVWFGRSPAAEQHANMARYRAVEFRRPMVRCANTGVSMLVDRTGRATRSLGTFVMGEIRGKIHPETTRTPYARWGDWILVPAALLIAASVVLRRQSTESPTREGARVV
jgi:apolipoprotein N-acyltransferase